MRHKKFILALFLNFTPHIVTADENVSICGNNNLVKIYSTRAISNYPILPSTNISKIDSIKCLVSVTVAKSEFEPASIVLKTSKTLSGPLILTATPFIHNDGRPGMLELEIKTVKPWYQAKGAWKSVGKPAISPNSPILVPELMLNDLSLIKTDKATKNNYIRVTKDNKTEYLNKSIPAKIKRSIDHLAPDYTFNDSNELKPFLLHKDENQQVWLTIHATKDVRPGTYTSRLISNNTNGEKLGEIPIEVKVLPFTLDESNLEHQLYYHARLHESKRESISSQFKSKHQLKVELKDMLDHGIKNPVIYQQPFLSHKLFSEYLDIRNSLGIDNSRLYLIYLNSNNVSTDQEINDFKRNINIVKNLIKPYGTTELYLYGQDEAKGADLINQLRSWQIAHEMGVKIFAAGYKGTFEAVGNELDLFILARSPMRKEANKFHSVGNRIFSYANPQGGVENPYIYRLNYGLLLWAANLMAL